jgi:hypothetical protein
MFGNGKHIKLFFQTIVARYSTTTVNRRYKRWGYALKIANKRDNFVLNVLVHGKLNFGVASKMTIIVCHYIYISYFRILTIPTNIANQYLHSNLSIFIHSHHIFKPY